MTKEQIADHIVAIISPLLTGAPHVEVKADEMGILYTLTVPDEDFGKVVGKEGATIKAIRTIITAIGMVNKMRTSIKVVDPVKDQH